MLPAHRRIQKMVVFLALMAMAASLVTGCGARQGAPVQPPAQSGEQRPPATQPPAAQPPQKPEPPPQTGPALRVRKDGGKTIFGPFSSWRRGVDWFWLKDGQRLIVTMETASATQQGPAPGGPGAGPEPEPVIQLWLVGAATGESRLLREVKGLDAMFPVAWNGAESVVCLDLPAAQGQPTKLTVTDFSGGKASSRSVADLQGTLRSHAATPDGRLISIHLGTRDGGEIRRINTADGSTKDLITGLPVWDGLYPVWFSPDGRSAAMPDPRNGGRPWRLRLLSIVTGELKHVDPYLDLIDFVRWSPDGRHLAFKVADGSHKLIDVADFSSVLSPKVRVLDETGKVVREFDMAKGHFIGDIEWLDENTLVLGERKSAQEDGPAWVAGLQSTGDGLKPAAPAQAAILKDRPDTYPMPKRGSSSKFKVTVRSWQDQGKAPSEELIITPVG